MNEQEYTTPKVGAQNDGSFVSETTDMEFIRAKDIPKSIVRDFLKHLGQAKEDVDCCEIIDIKLDYREGRHCQVTLHKVCSRAARDAFDGSL